MKKILAALLALVTITSVALVSCKNNERNNPDATGNSDDNGGFVIGTKDTSNKTDDTSNKPSGDWEAANYTIYAMANNLNVRAEDSDTADKLGKLNVGDPVTAVETDGDWYKITYNNATAYVNAKFVTRNKDEATFEACEPEALKVKNEIKDADAEKDIDKYVAVTLRTDPVIDNATISGTYLIYSDTQNSELQKVGESKDGSWYKVTYKENIYYIGSGTFKYLEGHGNGNAGIG